jgi:hypothetical protein
MATPKKSYQCEFCQKPVVGYQARWNHEKSCPLNPANDAGRAKAEEQVPGPPPGPKVEKEATPPRPDDIGAAVEAQVNRHMVEFGRRFEDMEKSLGASLQGAVSNVEGQLTKVPGMIDQAVANFLAAKFTDPKAEEKPAAEAKTPDAILPAASGNGSSGSLLKGLSSQIDIGKLIVEFLKVKGGGDINSAIAQFIFGQMKKSGRQLVPDTKYTSRGMGHVLSLIRLKKGDPDTQALSALKIAEEMLREKAISADAKGYFIGMKTGAEAYLEGRKMQGEIEKAAIVPPPPGAS